MFVGPTTIRPMADGQITPHQKLVKRFQTRNFTSKSSILVTFHDTNNFLNRTDRPKVIHFPELRRLLVQLI